MRNSLPGLTLLVSTVLCSSVSAAQTIHPLDDIVLTVERFLLTSLTTGDDKTEILVGRLDTRLRLPQCPAALDAFFPASAARTGNTTVGVRCEGVKPWTLYVTATIKQLRTVLILDRAIARGDLIQVSDLKLEERDVGRLSQAYLTDFSEAVGKVARMPLVQGMVLGPNLITAPMLVHRGETVTLVAVGGGMEVRTTGKALRDASEGQRVAVQNLDSNRVVEGTVVSAGVVKIRM